MKQSPNSYRNADDVWEVSDSDTEANCKEAIPPPPGSVSGSKDLLNFFDDVDCEDVDDASSLDENENENENEHEHEHNNEPSPSLPYYPYMNKAVSFASS